MSQGGTVQDVQQEPAAAEPKFNPFTGVGRRLDGKPLKALASDYLHAGNLPLSSSNNQQQASASSSGRSTPGKLVFGSNSNNVMKEARKDTKKEVKVEPPKEPKFQAFTGKYSLRGIVQCTENSLLPYRS